MAIAIQMLEDYKFYLEPRGIAALIEEDKQVMPIESAKKTKLQSRFEAFKKCYPVGKNWEYMCFINDRKREFTNGDPVYTKITDDDAFTAYIQQWANSYIRDKAA